MVSGRVSPHKMAPSRTVSFVLAAGWALCLTEERILS